MSLNINSGSDDSTMSVDYIITSTMDPVNKNRILTPPLLFNKSNESSERYESLPNRSLHENFLRKCIDEILSTAIFEDCRRENKVLDFHQPNELAKLFDMSLKAQSDSDEKLLDLLRKTIKYSVKTGHPYFVNQLFSCVDPYALIGQWLTDSLNPSVYTYEVSPVFVLMEEVVLREMRTFIGWENGRGDGLFSPGGSIANGYGISCARYAIAPEVKVRTAILTALHLNLTVIFFNYFKITYSHHRKRD